MDDPGHETLRVPSVARRPHGQRPPRRLLPHLRRAQLGAEVGTVRPAERAVGALLLAEAVQARLLVPLLAGQRAGRREDRVEVGRGGVGPAREGGGRGRLLRADRGPEGPAGRVGIVAAERAGEVGGPGEDLGRRQGTRREQGHEASRGVQDVAAGPRRRGAAPEEARGRRVAAVAVAVAAGRRLDAAAPLAQQPPRLPRGPLVLPDQGQEQPRQPQRVLRQRRRGGRQQRLRHPPRHRVARAPEGEERGQGHGVAGALGAGRDHGLRDAVLRPRAAGGSGGGGVAPLSAGRQ